MPRLRGRLGRYRDLANEFAVAELGPEELARYHVLDARDDSFAFRIRRYRITSCECFQGTDRIKYLRNSFQLLGPRLHETVDSVV